MFKKFQLTLLLLLTLSQFGCGFQPIYKTNVKTNEVNFEKKLASIKISGDRKRLFQKLQNNLEEILNPNKIDVPKEYLLVIKLSKQTSVTFINPTGSAGRNKVTLNVTYELKTIEDDDIVARGSTSAKDDFNVENKRFANYITEEEIELNLTRLIAQNLRDSLINDLFNKNKN